MDDRHYVALLLRLLAKVMAVGSIKPEPKAPIFPPGYGTKGWLPTWLEDALLPSSLPCPNNVTIEMEDRVTPSMGLAMVTDIDAPLRLGATDTTPLAQVPNAPTPTAPKPASTPDGACYYRYDYWLAKAVNEMDRYRHQDILFPSHHNVITVAALDAVALLQQRGLVPIDLDFYLFYAKPGHFVDVRLAALHALLSLGTTAAAALSKQRDRVMRVLFTCMTRDPLYAVRTHLMALFLDFAAQSKAHRTSWLHMTSPTIFQHIHAAQRYSVSDA